MSARFLVIGDLHLREGEHLDDAQSCLAFASQVATERNASAVLLAGDIYEGRSTVAERALASRALLELSALGAREVIICRGNHDQAGDLEVFAGYTGIHVVERPRVLTHRTPTGSVDVLCVPWPERAYLAASGFAGEAGDRAGSAALAAMVRAMAATRQPPDRPLVVLGHLQVLGALSSSAQPLVGRAIEAVLGDLQDLGAAAVVLGHVHRPQQLGPGVEYVGSLTVHDFGEEDETKRLVLLTVHDDGTAEWESIPVPCRRWVTIDAAVGAGPDGQRGRVLERINGLDLTPDESATVTFDVSGCNVRYRYRCTEEETALFDHVAIERRFAGAHTLKIVPEIERAQRVRAADVAAARTVEDKLRAWGAATGEEITPALIEKLHTLEVAHG